MGGGEEVKKKGAEGESDTESEEESTNVSPPTTLTAWYSTQLNASQASTLTKESGEVSWQTVELSIRVAWDKGSMDVMGAKDERCKDGTYPAVKVGGARRGGSECDAASTPLTDWDPPLSWHSTQKKKVMRKKRKEVERRKY